MPVAGGFLQLTDERAIFVIAARVLAVGVRAFPLRDGAGQPAPLRGIALVRVNMYRFCSRLGITALIMGVGFHLGKRTPQVPIRIKTGITMLMDDKIGVAAAICPIFIQAGICMLVQAKAFQRACRNGLALGSHLGIASLAMGMLCFFALRRFFQSDRRKNQSACGAKRNHTG